MESKVSYTLVGSFVIVLGLALVIVALWLAGGLGDRLYDTYRVYVRESVSGLNPRSAVRYRGVDVGQVSSIRLDPDDPRRVIVTLQIEQGTPIREDTAATLTIQGLTGLATVELSGGSPGSPPLRAAEGEPYPVIRSLPSLVQRLDNAFNDALEVMQQLSADLGALLSPANQQAVASVLANVNTISTTVAAESAAIRSTLVHLDTVTGAIAAQAEAIDQSLVHLAALLAVGAETGVGVNRLVTQLENSVATVDAMVQSVDQAVVATQSELSLLMQRSGPELDALVLEINQLTDSVQRFMQVLERDPQILLFGRPSVRPGPGEQGR